MVERIADDIHDPHQDGVGVRLLLPRLGHPASLSPPTPRRAAASAKSPVSPSALNRTVSAPARFVRTDSSSEPAPSEIPAAWRIKATLSSRSSARSVRSYR